MKKSNDNINLIHVEVYIFLLLMNIQDKLFIESRISICLIICGIINQFYLRNTEYKYIFLKYVKLLAQKLVILEYLRGAAVPSPSSLYGYASTLPSEQC